MLTSQIFLLHFRTFSTKSAKVRLNAADLIKAYNNENKALFGAVHKKKKKDEESKSVPAISSDESEMSSEMFWLLEHKAINVNEKINKTEKKSFTTRKKKIPLMAVSKLNLKSLKTPTSTNSSEEQCLEKTSTSPTVDIPFSNKGLKSIATFPLFVTEEVAYPETTENYKSYYPSVGKILQATLSDSARKALINWKLNKIKELGDEAFKRMQEAQLYEGKLFHKSLEDYLCSGIVPTEDAVVYKLWKSIHPALEKLDPKIEFAEKMIEHPFLKYRGIVDCVCTVNSKTTVIEWKKSEKLKTDIATTYDAPLQLCAYLGALTADPQYKLNATKGYVIVAHTEGQPAQVHHLDEVDLQRYWHLWLRRLQEFWIRTRDGTLPEPI